MSTDHRDRVRLAVAPRVAKKFTAQQLATVAEVAGEHGDVATTVSQHLLVSVPGSAATLAEEQLQAAGLQVFPAWGVMRNLRTCSFCSETKTQPLAEARALEHLVAGTEVPFPVRIHLDGCHYVCGEAITQDIGLVRKQKGYDVYIGARTYGEQPVIGRKLTEGLPPEHLAEQVQHILSVYRAHAQKSEHFSKVVERLGLEPFRLGACTPQHSTQ